MPYTLADLDAIYTEPQQENQEAAAAAAAATATAAGTSAAAAAAAASSAAAVAAAKGGDTVDSLEQDLNALQETLDKDMLEMERDAGLLPSPGMEDDSLQLQEIMVDNVVASEVTLEDDVFDRDEILDVDPQDSLKDDFD